MNYLETVTTVATVFIAACALVATIVQGRQNRKHNRLSNERIEKHNRLSVKPFLTTINNITRQKNSSKKRVEIDVKNCGIGPALIKNFILEVNGKEITRNDIDTHREFLEKNTSGFDYENIGFMSTRSAITAGESQNLWIFEYEDGNKIKLIEGLNVRIEYQSIYEDEILHCNSRRDLKVANEMPFDAQIMAHIHAACFTVPRPWTEQEFAVLLEKKNTVFVNCPHGFAIGQRLDDTQTELLTLAIFPDEQGKGHGQGLLNVFIAEVKNKGGQNILLEVAENNAPALHLYEKAGFKKTGIRPAYYEVPNAPNINAVLMHLDIKNQGFL